MDAIQSIPSIPLLATRLFHPKLIKMRLGEDLIYRRVL